MFYCLSILYIFRKSGQHCWIGWYVIICLTSLQSHTYSFQIYRIKQVGCILGLSNSATEECEWCVCVSVWCVWVFVCSRWCTATQRLHSRRGETATYHKSSNAIRWSQVTCSCSIFLRGILLLADVKIHVTWIICKWLWVVFPCVSLTGICTNKNLPSNKLWVPRV